MRTAYRIGRDLISIYMLFYFLTFPSVAYFHALKEEDSARNGIAARPFRFQESLY